MNLQDLGTKEERDDFINIIRSFLKDNEISTTKYSCFIRLKICISGRQIQILPNAKECKIYVCDGNQLEGTMHNIRGSLNDPKNSLLQNLLEFCKAIDNTNKIFERVTESGQWYFL